MRRQEQKTSSRLPGGAVTEGPLTRPGKANMLIHHQQAAESAAIAAQLGRLLLITMGLATLLAIASAVLI